MKTVQLLWLAWSVLISSPAAASTWVVPSEVPHLRAALAACAPGDTVLVEDGVYTGPDNRDLLVPTIDVVLKSVGGPGACTFDCQDMGRWLEFSGGSAHCSIEGFRVIHGQGDLGGAILAGGVNLQVRECVFAENTGGWGGALAFLGITQSLEIEDCTFHANMTTVTGQGGALLMIGNGLATIRRSIFDHNQTTYAGAINVQAGMLVRIENCTISDNAAVDDAGGISTSSAQLDIRNSIIRDNICAGNNPGDIYAINQTIEPQCCDFNLAEITSEGWTLEKCFDSDPLFCDADPGWDPNYPNDYRLRGDSPCLPGASPCGALVGALDQGCYAPWIGACCTGLSCTMTTETECVQSGGVFQGNGSLCEPNPCQPIPTIETTWGRIKAQYR